MLIYQNSAAGIPFNFPRATTPNRYFICKPSYFGARLVGQLGVGTIYTYYNATGTQGIYKLKLDPTETDELGPLGVQVDDSTSMALWVGDVTVVKALPGDLVDVNEVQGDVDGTLSIDNRHNIADSVWERFDGIELGLNPKQCMQAMFSILAGLLRTSGDQSTFQNFGRTKDRVTMTLRPGGNRIDVTYNFD